MITIRHLQCSPEVVSAVQAALDGAPLYSRLTSGRPPAPDSAESIFEAMPPGKNKEDKFVLGIYDSETCVGVIDLIRGYPSPDTAMLGLLLIAESHHGRGVGTAAFSQLANTVRSWPEAKKIRIGVFCTNAMVQPFWQRLGFRPTGEVKPYSNGSISSQVTILELELQSAAFSLPEDRS